MNETLYAILFVVIVIVVVIGLALGIAYPLSRAHCIGALKEMGIDGSYRLFGGCFVNTDDFGVIPFDQYMFVITKGE